MTIHWILNRTEELLVLFQQLNTQTEKPVFSSLLFISYSRISSVPAQLPEKAYCTISNKSSHTVQLRTLQSCVKLDWSPGHQKASGFRGCSSWEKSKTENVTVVI